MQKNVILLKVSTVLIALALSLVCDFSYAGITSNEFTDYDTVFISDFGLKPNSRINAVKAVKEALNACKRKDNPLLIFPKGRYDFWPQYAVEKVYYESNTTDNNPKRSTIFIYGMQNLTIDGRDSKFIYHGRVQPFTIDNSQNITLKNFTIDWEIPLTGQAEIIAVNKDYIDIQIDVLQHPYIIENKKLFFVGEGWKSIWGRVMEYEKEAHIIAPGTGDIPGALGPGWRDYNAEELEYGVVRLHHDFKRKPKKGNFLIMRHTDRDHAMIFIKQSKDIEIKNITGHHCAGLGILSQYSENLSFFNVNMVPNTDKGRYFSGHDDGLHFSGCKGRIVVDSCRFAGLMDDPINIHGTYVKIIERKGPKTLRCRFMQPMSVGMEWARKGEEIAYIDNRSLATIARGIVANYKYLNPTDFEITLEKEIPEEVSIGYGLENITWTPSAIIRNSFFGGNRARGILITTPKPVLVENNIFKSSGSAILIAGDVNSWYESGEVNDILIRGNKFLPATNSSIYQFTEAVISIFPEVPEMSADTPPFHENIRIIDNEFYMYDYPVLFAQSVDGLLFQGNKLFRSYDFEPFHPRKFTFSFLGCKNLRISNNHIDKDLLGKNILYKYMPVTEINLDQEELMVVETDIPDYYTHP